MVVNRVMIDNYLTSLKRGLEKNKKEYMEIVGKEQHHSKNWLIQ